MDRWLRHQVSVGNSPASDWSVPVVRFAVGHDDGWGASASVCSYQGYSTIGRSKDGNLSTKGSTSSEGKRYPYIGTSIRYEAPSLYCYQSSVRPKDHLPWWANNRSRSRNEKTVVDNPPRSKRRQQSYDTYDTFHGRSRCPLQQNRYSK